MPQKSKTNTIQDQIVVRDENGEYKILIDGELKPFHQESFSEPQKKEVTDIMRKEIPIVSTGLIAGFIPGIGNAVLIIDAGRDMKNLLKERGTLKSKAQEKETNFINLLLTAHGRK